MKNDLKNEEQKEQKLEIKIENNFQKQSDPNKITNDLTKPNTLNNTEIQIFYSSKFVYVYIILLVPSLIIVLFLIYYFITRISLQILAVMIIEWILNVLMVLDIAFRIKVFGLYKFLRNHQFDLIITSIIIACVALTLTSIKLNSIQWYIERYSNYN